MKEQIIRSLTVLALVLGGMAHAGQMGGLEKMSGSPAAAEHGFTNGFTNGAFQPDSAVVAAGAPAGKVLAALAPVTAAKAEHATRSIDADRAAQAKALKTQKAAYVMLTAGEIFALLGAVAVIVGLSGSIAALAIAGGAVLVAGAVAAGFGTAFGGDAYRIKEHRKKYAD